MNGTHGNAPPNISQDCFSFLFSSVGKDEDHVAKEDRPYVLQITESFSDSISTRWNGYLEEVMLVLVHDCEHRMYACVAHDDRRASLLNAGTYLAVSSLRIMEYMPGKMCILLKEFEVIWSEKPSKRPCFPVDISKLKLPSHGIVNRQQKEHSEKKSTGGVSRITTNAASNSAAPTGFEFRDCAIVPRNPPTTPTAQNPAGTPTKNDADANNSRSKRIPLQQPAPPRSYFLEAELIDRTRIPKGGCAAGDRSQQFGGHPLQDRMNRCPEGYHQQQQHNNRIRPDMRNFEQQNEPWMHANQMHIRQENLDESRWKYFYDRSVRSGAPNGMYDRQTKKKPKVPLGYVENEEMIMNFWGHGPNPTPIQSLQPQGHIPHPPKIPPPKPIVLDPRTGRPINAPYAAPTPPSHSFQANWHQSHIVSGQHHPSTYLPSVKSFTEPVYNQHVQFCGPSPSQNIDRRNVVVMEEVALRNPKQVATHFGQTVGNDNTNMVGAGGGAGWTLGNSGVLNQGNVSGTATGPDWNDCHGDVEYQVATQRGPIPTHGMGEKPDVVALEMRKQTVFGGNQRGSKQVGNENVMVHAARVSKRIESGMNPHSLVSGSIGARYGPITRPGAQEATCPRQVQCIAENDNQEGAPIVENNPDSPLPPKLLSPRTCQDDIVFGSFRLEKDSLKKTQKSKEDGKSTVKSMDAEGEEEGEEIAGEKKPSKKIGAKPRRKWSDVVKDS